MPFKTPDVLPEHVALLDNGAFKHMEQLSDQTIGMFRSHTYLLMFEHVQKPGFATRISRLHSKTGDENTATIQNEKLVDNMIAQGISSNPIDVVTDEANIQTRSFVLQKHDSEFLLRCFTTKQGEASWEILSVNPYGNVGLQQALIDHASIVRSLLSGMLEQSDPELKVVAEASGYEKVEKIFEDVLKTSVSVSSGDYLGCSDDALTRALIVADAHERNMNDDHAYVRIFGEIAHDFEEALQKGPEAIPFSFLDPHDMRLRLEAESNYRLHHLLLARQKNEFEPDRWLQPDIFVADLVNEQLMDVEYWSRKAEVAKYLHGIMDEHLKRGKFTPADKVPSILPEVIEDARDFNLYSTYREIFQWCRQWAKQKLATYPKPGPLTETADSQPWRDNREELLYLIEILDEADPDHPVWS